MVNLYNSRGRTIGYYSRDSVYNTRGKRVGKINGDKVTDKHGKYIGTIYNENRLYYFSSHSAIRGSSFGSTISGVASKNIIGTVAKPAGAKDVDLDNL